MTTLTQTFNHKNKSFFSIDKKIEEVDFLNLTVEDILIEHHKRNSITTNFILNADKQSNSVMFLVSQDLNLINKLKMTIPNEEKTFDIFEPNKQNFLSSVSIKTLLNNLENNKNNYELSIDNRDYSFLLVKGIKIKNILTQITDYVDGNITNKNNTLKQ